MSVFVFRVMNATLSTIPDFGTDEAFNVTVRHGRSQHVYPNLYTPPTTSTKGANRSWPTAQGFIYVVDTYPGLAQLAKTLLALDGFSVCAFEDRTKALRAFAFACPRPGVLITNNLDGEAEALRLIQQCRSLEPNLKTLLVDHRLSSSMQETETDLINGRLSLPYCGPLLVEQVRRLCPGWSGRNGIDMNKFSA